MERHAPGAGGEFPDGREGLERSPDWRRRSVDGSADWKNACAALENDAEALRDAVRGGAKGDRARRLWEDEFPPKYAELRGTLKNFERMMEATGQVSWKAPMVFGLPATEDRSRALILTLRPVVLWNGE